MLELHLVGLVLLQRASTDTELALQSVSKSVYLAFLVQEQGVLAAAGNLEEVLELGVVATVVLHEASGELDKLRIHGVVVLFLLFAEVLE